MPLIFPYGWRQALSLSARRVHREMLDHLPPENPEARASRSDLFLINSLLGNFHWISRQIEPLLKRWRSPLRVLELGAGDGALPLSLPRRWHRRLHWTGLDRISWPPREEMMGWTRWIQGDARKVKWPDCEVLVANLFLHHFDDATLGLLASKVPASTRLILICEPLRCRRAILGLLILHWVAINRVTWHDGVVSVAAGFRKRELRELFVLNPDWQWKERSTLLGTLRVRITREPES